MNLKAFSKKYLNLLTDDYKDINLTRILNEEEFYNKQILDSIKPYIESAVFQESLKNSKVLIDVGFGGGFPLLPLMFHVEQSVSALGIESKKKKCEVVGEIAKKLSLDKIKFLHSRLENVFFDKNATITLKAVGKVNDYLSLIKTNSVLEVFFYKGPSFYEQEMAQLEIAKKNWTIIEEKSIEIEGTDKRILIGFRNKNVLRGTNSTESVVKVSDFV